MSNKQTAAKSEKSNDFSGKNGQGSARQKKAATNEPATKNQRDASKHMVLYFESKKHLISTIINLTAL